MAILCPHFIILCEKFQIKLDISTTISFNSLVEQRKVIVSWCYGNYCYFALVSWCGHCSVSFQFSVLCHLVIVPVRKTKIAPGKWGKSARKLITRKYDVCCRFLNSFFFLPRHKNYKVMSHHRGWFPFLHYQMMKCTYNHATKELLRSRKNYDK